MFNIMFRGVVIFFMCFFLSLLQATASQAAGQLVENWNTKGAHDAAWLSVGDSDTQIFIQQATAGNGELHQITRPFSSLADISSDSWVRFDSGTGSNLTGLQATVRLQAIGDVGQTPEIDFSAIGFGGIFYNVNVAPTDATGDVFFVIRFGDRGNGLEVWYEIDVSTNGDFTQANEFASGVVTPPPGGWQTGTDYLLEFDYNEDDRFDITFNDTNISATGPARGGGSFFDTKWIRSRIWYLQPFSGDPDVNTLHAVIDDVEVGLNGGGVAPFDNFNGAAEALDVANWREPARVITVENNMLKMQVKAATADQYRSSTVLPTQYLNTPNLQADIMMMDGFVNDNGRGEASIGGYFGNESGNYNGLQGNIWLSARIEKENGAYRSVCYGFRELDAQGNNQEDLFFDVVPASPDTFYRASIQLDGTVASCSFKDMATGVITHEFTIDLTQPPAGIAAIFPTAPGTEHRRLHVRHRNFNAGEVVAFFDNVFSGTTNPLLLELIPVITKEKEAQ